MTVDGFTTVLFDLDGTLIDSIELILSSYRHTLRIHRGTIPSDEAWLRGLGTPLRCQFEEWTSDPDEIEAMIATYRAHHLAHHDRMVRPYPGITALVAALAGRVRLAVVTSKSHEGAARGLARCGIAAPFEAIVGADDVTRAKPDPEPVWRALESLGADPGSSVFVGDSPHDMAAGRAAGVRTAAALWGPFGRPVLETQRPDHWLDRPSALAALCQA